MSDEPTPGISQRIADENAILRCTVGSALFGTSIGPSSDRDEMGICVEPPEYVIGLRRFEQYVYRTRPEGERSGPDDLDLVVYGLRKWTSLALKGNPAVLPLMFAPSHAILYEEPTYANAVRALASAVASRKAGNAFLGYMVAQKQRLLGERGQMRVKRPELVEEHGYDTKYAGQIVRLAYQGIEYMRSGRITLPMPDGWAEEVVAVRRGQLELNHVLMRIGELESDLEQEVASSPLPDEPDHWAVNDGLINIYQSWWRANGLVEP